MVIPTEPIGSIPRPLPLVAALAETDCDDPALDPLYEEAIRDTIARFEETGSPVITDGEQRKYHNFGTYCVEGMPNLAPDGFKRFWRESNRSTRSGRRKPTMSSSCTMAA